MTYRDKLREALGEIFSEIDKIEDPCKLLQVKIGVLETLADFIKEEEGDKSIEELIKYQKLKIKQIKEQTK